MNELLDIPEVVNIVNEMQSIADSKKIPLDCWEQYNVHYNNHKAINGSYRHLIREEGYETIMQERRDTVLDCINQDIENLIKYQKPIFGRDMKS
jgi:hypothetical protein